MKGTGLAVFSEPASPVPGYDLSRIITDIKQSQEMKLTHAKLHYGRVRSPAAQGSWYKLTRAGRKSRWVGAEHRAVPRTAHTHGGRALRWALPAPRLGHLPEMLCYVVCPQLSLLSPLPPPRALMCCKSKLKTCQQAQGLMGRADA